MIDDQTYEKTIRDDWFEKIKRNHEVAGRMARLPESKLNPRVQDCIDLGADSEPQMLDAIPTEPGDLDDTRRSVEGGLILSVGLVFGGVLLGWVLARVFA